jgi:hypothetical protein
MIDTMKQALEALEYHQEQTRPIHKTQETITTLRQAIEQAEKQEPVGWFMWDAKQELWVQVYPNTHGFPLYKAPPKREFVGLTDEEITEYSSWLSGRNVVRAIEQRLKEKNT